MKGIICVYYPKETGSCYEAYAPHLKALQEIEREGISGLVEVLGEEGIDAVRYVLWGATGRHPWGCNYFPATAVGEASLSPPISRKIAISKEPLKTFPLPFRLLSCVGFFFLRSLYVANQSKRAGGASSC